MCVRVYCMSACIGDACNNCNKYRHTVLTAEFPTLFITIFVTKKRFGLEFVMFFFSFPDSCAGLNAPQDAQ